MTKAGLAAEVDALLAGFGVARQRYTGGTLKARSPISGEIIAVVHETDPGSARNAIEDAHTAFLVWRNTPANASRMIILRRRSRARRPRTPRAASIT